MGIPLYFGKSGFNSLRDGVYCSYIEWNYLKKVGVTMNITDIRIRKLHNEGKMKAVVSVTIDDAFVIHDIKIIDGNNGLFVAMPSRKVSEEEYRDIAHPINSTARSSMQDRIFAEYHKAMLDRMQSTEHFDPIGE